LLPLITYIILDLYSAVHFYIKIIPKVTPFLEGASSKSIYGVLKNTFKNSISAATVTPEMLERVHGNIVKRANACLDANGQNFEHLLFFLISY
jgi:hypothetical protein